MKKIIACTYEAYHWEVLGWRAIGLVRMQCQNKDIFHIVRGCDIVPEVVFTAIKAQFLMKIRFLQK